MTDSQKLLVYAIKATGQELIERAEEMVGKNDLISDFDIYVHFPAGWDAIPEIEWTTTAVNRNALKVVMEVNK